MRGTNTHRSLLDLAQRAASLRHLAALCLSLGLTLSACGSDDDDVDEADAGADASLPDSGSREDAGDEDAGNEDAGDEDAGDEDAGNEDAGNEDAGDEDAGDEDAGSADPDTVMTKAGPVKGETVDYEGKSIRVFKGVPYAASTAGDNRWRPPQPLEPWTEVREATEWGDRCPQGGSMLSSPGDISEDCLVLNLLTPATEEDEKLPVMVFFHGGGLSIGTGNSETYCNEGLPAKGVVLITVNSRLGPFGYFSHPALTAEAEAGEEGEGAAANYGTLDLIESLKWVQENVEAFGGDPDNVTIFGESGGGSKVLSCMASPLSEGLFHRAVVQSGSRSSAEGSTTALDVAETRGEAVVAEMGIAEDDDVLDNLRDADWMDVLAASAVMETGYLANLTQDGYVLPKSVHEAFVDGEQMNVPLMVGANEGEVGELSGTVPELAAKMSSVSSEAYVYNFTHLPKGWQEPGCYSFHGLELPYVFGHMEGLTSATIIFLGGTASCDTAKAPANDEDDDTVAENAMNLWVQFAKTGDPSLDGTDWPPYTADGDEYLDIGVELEVKTGVATSGKMPGDGAEDADDEEEESADP